MVDGERTSSGPHRGLADWIAAGWPYRALEMYCESELDVKVPPPPLPRVCTTWPEGSELIYLGLLAYCR